MAANKVTLSKSVLICLYGFPGSGKSYVARNLAETIQIANVSGDRVRSELFENPRYDTQENAIVSRLYHMGLISSDVVQHSVAKPGLVNLVPNPHAGRVDLSRRNIVIR